MSNRTLPTGAASEIIGHFFKALAGRDASREWCIRHGVGLVKAGTEFPDTAGGFLTPDGFRRGDPPGSRDGWCVPPRRAGAG